MLDFAFGEMIAIDFEGREVGLWQIEGEMVYEGVIEKGAIWYR